MVRYVHYILLDQAHVMVQLTPGKLLSDYNMEQQAAIMADYDLLNNYNVGIWSAFTKEKNKKKIFQNDKIRL
jgi:hypothetical protein